MIPAVTGTIVYGDSLEVEDGINIEQVISGRKGIADSKIGLNRARSDQIGVVS